MLRWIAAEEPHVILMSPLVYAKIAAFWPASYFFKIRLFPICRARTRTDVCYRYNDTVGRTNRIVIKIFHCTAKSLSLRSAFKEL